MGQVDGDAVKTDGLEIGAPTNRTVNGQLNPTIEIGLGEVQLWRLANISANIHYQLRLRGKPPPPMPMPSTFAPPQDLSDLPIAVWRTIVVSENAAQNEYYVNCHILNHEDKGMMAVLEIVN